MEYGEAKAKFIQSWGVLGSSWGINRTMAQIHALLLIAPDALSTEDIMAELNISRGNANMNVRALIDWGIVYKEFKAGERKEFFKADKDIWQVAIRVTQERRKRELEPMLRVLADLKDMKGGAEKPELDEFKKVTND
ncbi:MAG: transcriptional regulator, partial [Bacteroidota bacterium]